MDKSQILYIEKWLVIILAITCLGLTYYFLFTEPHPKTIPDTQWCADFCKKKDVKGYQNGESACECTSD